MRDEDPAGLGFRRWGRKRSGPNGDGMPSAVAVIIGINVAVYLLQWGLGVFWDARPGYNQPMGAVSRQLLLEGKIWLLATHMFVHGSFLHILFNMALVFMAGRLVEQVLGSRRFYFLYFGSGLTGAIGQVLVSENPMVGASGAAFGLLVAFGMILWDTRVMALIAMVFPVRLRARMLVLGVVITEIVLFVASLFVPENREMFLVSGIAHMAHLGGALFSYYYCKMLGFGGGKLVSRDELRNERAQRESKGEKGSRWGRRAEKERVVNAEENTAPREFISREIDPILDKVAAHGMQSLTADERKILEAGSRKIAERQK
jgi:membrane associated rhomboid family serine protease